MMIFLSTFGTVASTGEFSTEYVPMGRQSSVIYSPKEQSSGIGIVVMHSDMDYMNFKTNIELSERGHVVIATRPPSTHNLEEKLIYIKNCVDYLRKRDDVKKIVLLGHSGGATTMTAYQLLAENGRDALDDKIYKDYTSAIDSLSQADGMLLMDANYGLSTMTLISLDPNVNDQDRGTGVNEILNPGDISVGYNPDGASNYKPWFIKAYNAAQARRFNLLKNMAEKGIADVNNGSGAFTEDEPFIVAGAALMKFYNKLILQDTTLLSHTKGSWPLLNSKGEITEGIIHCVRHPLKYVNSTPSYNDAVVTTVKGWMSSFAINISDDFRVTETEVTGVDWTSNINSPIGNISGINAPTLFMGMTAGYEFIASEMMYGLSPANDKTLIFAEGADHMFDPEKPEYDGITTAIFDYVDNWLRDRFGN